VPGGFQLSSFFDIFTDISLDDGKTWLPALDQQRVALTPRAPEVVSKEPELTPPNGAYVSAVNAEAIVYPGLNIITRKYKHDRMTLHRLPPLLGESVLYTSPGRVQFEVSFDGGSKFSLVSANADTAVRLANSQDVGPIQFFETEMTQLDIFGGDLPQGVRLRISPTRKSGGQATIQPHRGGYLLSSFFDIFTELSIDGGATWTAATSSSRLGLESRAPAIFSVSDNLTPPNGAYISPANSPEIRYPNNIITRFYVHDWMSLHFTLPPLGGPPVIYQSPGRVQFQVSVNGGESFSDVLAEANTTVRMIHNQDVGPVQFFDTEMLQLDIFGGNLPEGVRLRISPDRKAAGQATIAVVPPQAGEGYLFRVDASTAPWMSRFYEAIVRQKQLSPGAIAAFNEETRGPGLLRIIGTVAPGKTPAELEAAIDAEIERVKTGPIEEWEIEKARNGVRSQVIAGLGSSLQRAVQLGENALFYDRPEKINTRADEIARVSAADVQRVARTYLVKTGRTVVYTVPKPAAPTGGK
jgi:hypothetical protein